MLLKGTANLSTNKPAGPAAIYFDIETGGFWATAQQSLIQQRKEGIKAPVAKPSSILSVSFAQGSASATSYSRPVPGSWVSQFSAEHILPQLEGQTTVSEADTIRSFINQLRANPEAPIAGYNIAGFDLEFMQGRARVLGMGDEFRELIQQRRKIDVGFEVRDLIAGAIDRQITDGVFADQLGGRTFASLELEYFGGSRRPGVPPKVPFAEQDPNFKILSQVRGFMRHGMQGRVEGWKLSPVFEMYSKWAGMEDELSHLAHASAADVEMTRLLHEAVESGKFQQFVDRPEFGRQWMQMVHQQRAAGAGIPKTAGSFWRGAASAADDVVRPVKAASWWDNLHLPTKAEFKVLGIAAAAVAGAAVAYSAFSGYDDSYNTIEGLNHQGLAQMSRQSMTDFGSGYRGLPVAPEIEEFRNEVIANKEARDDLRAQLRELELEAQAELGNFETSDFMLFEKSVIEGMNQQRRDLRRVNLERFNIEVEDADSLILRRKGFFSWLFGDDILIRLAGIDAPEVSGHGTDPLEDIRWKQAQAGGEEAAEQLRQRIAASDDLDLVIATQGKTYGRYLGAVVADGENVNIELARSGAVSALPFGDIEEDIVSRAAVARAERQAQREELGIHKMARYKAIDVATEAAGRDITYNTITRLDKLASNMNMGRYATFLESLGDTERDLTASEATKAAMLGTKLRNRYSSRFSGKDDAFNYIEGLSHTGISKEIRQRMTEFGSGWRGTLSTAWNIFTHDELSLATTIGIQAYYERRKDGSATFGEVFTSGAVLGSLGFYAAGKGLRRFLDVPLFNAPWKDSGLSEAIGTKYRQMKYNRRIAKGGRVRNSNRSGNVIEGMSEKGFAKKSRKAYGFGSPWQGLVEHWGDLYSRGKDAVAIQNVEERRFRKQFAKRYKSSLTGMQEGGWAAIRRHQMTDFGSPVDLSKAAMRASKLYKGKLSELLGSKKLIWDEVEDAGELTLMAKSAEGKPLVALTRGFSKEGVDLTYVEIDKSLRGQGIGKALYASEPEIFREIGYKTGEAITSPVSSPVTARMQMMQYGSRAVGQGEDFHAKILSKTLTKADMGPGYTMRGSLGANVPAKATRKSLPGWMKRFERPLGVFFSAADDAWNKVIGLGKKGFSKILRKDNTNFGSGYRGLLSVPKILADKMELGLGRTANIEQLMKTTRGNISDLATEFGPKYGGVWQKSPMANEVANFYKGLKEASEAGFQDVMLVNPSAIQKLSEATEYSTGYITKHVIRHERLHMYRRLATPDSRVASSVAPEEFHTALKSVNYNRGNTSSYGEEFLANLTANIYQPLDVPLSRGKDRILSSDVITMGTAEKTQQNLDVIAALEAAGSQQRKNRMQASVAIKKLRRAEMQRKASKTVFVNASGGKNSRM